MPWLPTSTLLLTIDEIKNFSQSISYTSDLGVPEDVVVTAVDSNATVTVAGNTISGFYSDSFPNIDIQYRTPSDTFINVNKFSDINTNELDEMIYFKPDPTVSKTYNYIATSATSSQAYTIVVTNNWSVGRDTLIRYVETTVDAKQIALGNFTTVSWTNSAGTIVGWTNNSGQIINWANIV